jgi:hypothetical protein
MEFSQGVGEGKRWLALDGTFGLIVNSRKYLRKLILNFSEGNFAQVIT